MNKIKQIRELNKRELEEGMWVLFSGSTVILTDIYSSPEGSWHADYRDTAYIYIGGLPFELSEGDIITIFSQYGEPAFLNLVRDKETGKSRGFAFLKYEDQRSTDLAVDNLGGAVILGKTLSVDHTRYNRKEEEDGVDLLDESGRIKGDDEDRRKRRRTDESESEEERPMLKEERELAKLIEEHDEDDPMKTFLVQEKREEVEMALARLKDGKKSEVQSKHRHRHHRSRRHEEGDEKGRKRSPRRATSRDHGDIGRDREEGGKEKNRSSRRATSRERKDRGLEKDAWKGKREDSLDRERSPRRNDGRERDSARRRRREDSLDAKGKYLKRDS